MHNATVCYNQNWPAKTGHEFCGVEYEVKVGEEFNGFSGCNTQKNYTFVVTVACKTLHTE
jgi:hypothetical protein